MEQSHSRGYDRHSASVVSSAGDPYSGKICQLLPRFGLDHCPISGSPAILHGPPGLGLSKDGHFAEIDFRLQTTSF